MFESKDEDDTLTNILPRINMELPIYDYRQEKMGKIPCKGIRLHTFFKAFRVMPKEY